MAVHLPGGRLGRATVVEPRRQRLKQHGRLRGGQVEHLAEHRPGDPPHGVGRAHRGHRERVVVKEGSAPAAGLGRGHGDPRQPQGRGRLGQPPVRRANPDAPLGKPGQHLSQLAPVPLVRQPDNTDLHFRQQPPGGADPADTQRRLHVRQRLGSDLL